MTITLNRKNTVFYYIAITVIGILLVVFYFNSIKVKSTEKSVQHTRRVIDKNSEILLDIVNIETGARGFILTNNASFLEPYNESQKKINQNLAALLWLTKDNPTQQIRVKHLKELIIKRIDISKSLINNNNNNKEAEAATLIEGKAVMDAIRQDLKTINLEELALLKQRNSDNTFSSEFSKILLYALFFLLLVLVFFIYYLFKNQNKRNSELESYNINQKEASQYSLSLIEASLDPLVTINNEGKITDLNQATVRITGIEKDNLIGSDFFDYFTDHQKAREVYQAVFTNGSVTDAPLTIRHKEGKLTNVLFNGSVYKDELGTIKGVVIVARDIAEQKWALDLRSANNEMAFQNDEKEKRADELAIANKELLFQNDEKERRAAELVIANKELAYQNSEKEDRANELLLANEELAFQNQEKENRAEELALANKELEYQNKIKEKKAAELIIANKELAFQKDEKQNRADELEIANKELLFQIDEKQNRADELEIADKELDFQNREKEKRAIENKELEAYSYSLKLASQYSLSLIEASRDPLFTISIDGKITDTNQASVRVSGESKKTLIGSDFITYFTEPEKAKKGYEEVFSKGFVVDYPLTIKDGKLTPVLFNGSVYKDENGNIIGAVVVARDITEQKKAENELIEAKVFAELATEIAEQQQNKAEFATKIAENAVKAKQQFLSNMSHEIRTPMNAIIGFTKVVLKTDLSAKQREYLSAIKMSGDALIVLINDILDLAKVDAGKMIFEKVPFKLQQSIKAMLHVFETKIQENNLELVTQYDKNIPEVLLGDPVRLHQIILNLVSNATKFTTNGTITVSVNLLKEDDEKVTVEFEVADTGIGISEEKLDGIFENFQQASSNTSRLYGGTGLGLAIVKQLVEPQGGTIRVKSKVDEGSSFSFILDFSKTNDEAEIDTEIIEIDPENKNIKILVVEDMALNQLLMKTILDDFGFERDIAENGQIAINKLKTKSYDIVLMDLQMPVMNGFEATNYIRKAMNSKIPIIALTADVTTVDLSKCKAVGMDDYISKPVDEKLLYSKIIGLVKKPSLEKRSKPELNGTADAKKVKYIDLDYLNQRTKANPQLMMEMISLYLAQTPPIISAMKQSLLDKDFELLRASMHKMIPSFSIMGISSDFEEIARKIQEYASSQQLQEGIEAMALELEVVCEQVCKELEIEYKLLKNTIP